MVLETLANLLGDEDQKPNKFTIGMGELIRKAREETGLSQADLAQLVYRRRPTITDIENGKHEVDASTLALIAAAVNKPITYFYPRFLRKHIPAEDLTTTEQELIMQFRKLQLEDLERIAINLVKDLAVFDPYEALENIVDITKEKAGIREELNSKLKKSR
jgi:transcriptional regulator with XRE-family HTH domain